MKKVKAVLGLSLIMAVAAGCIGYAEERNAVVRTEAGDYSIEILEASNCFCYETNEEEKTIMLKMEIGNISHETLSVWENITVLDEAGVECMVADIPESGMSMQQLFQSVDTGMEMRVCVPYSVPADTAEITIRLEDHKILGMDITENLSGSCANDCPVQQDGERYCPMQPSQGQHNRENHHAETGTPGSGGQCPWVQHQEQRCRTNENGCIRKN